MRRRRALRELRFTIECLPYETRAAMLDGIGAERIIVGAYTDGRGGVCPLLAAHRRGGHADFASFADAWDAFTRTGRGHAAVGARPEHLAALRGLLELSLEGERPDPRLVAALEHVGELRRRPRPATSEEEPDCGSEVDRRSESGARPGWAWLRPVRSLEEYRIALSRAGEDTEEYLPDERPGDSARPAEAGERPPVPVLSR